MIDTGLDVPGGAIAPLGMKTFWDRGRIRAGITCALCHSTVDPRTRKVVHGAPNADFNAGLLLALAPRTRPPTSRIRTSRRSTPSSRTSAGP